MQQESQSVEPPFPPVNILDWKPIKQIIIGAICISVQSKNKLKTLQLNCLHKTYANKENGSIEKKYLANIIWGFAIVLLNQ